MNADGVAPVPSRVQSAQGEWWQWVAVSSCAVHVALMAASVIFDVMRLAQGEVINPGRVGVMALVVVCGMVWVGAVGWGVWRLRRECVVPGVVWCVLWLPVAWSLAVDGQQWALAVGVVILAAALALPLLVLTRLGAWRVRNQGEDEAVW